MIDENFSEKAKKTKKSIFFLQEIEGAESYILRNIYPILAIIFVSIGFLFLLGYSINSTNLDKEIPLIKAGTEPIKIIPQDPGGMIVHNIDKLVYNNLFGKAPKDLPKVERILPLPEVPLDVSKSITSQNQQTISKTEHIDNDIIDNNELEVSENFQKENDINNIKHDKLPIQVNDKINIKKLPTHHKSKINNLEFKNIKEPKKYKIQLASFKSEEEAMTEWRRIKNSHPTLLDRLKPYIAQKEILNKGIYYRLQAGVFDSDSEARSLCKKLNNHNKACIIVKD